VRLLPKDEKFWGFFTKQTASLSLASDILRRALHDGSASIAGAAVRLKAIERESAQTLRDLQLRLRNSFVTPLDPEDISVLSEHLDHLFDDLEAISYRLAAYQIDPMPPLVSELAGRIHASAELIEKAFGMLSLNDPIEELCKKIIEAEEQTDHCIREGVTLLFQEEKDPPALMKKKEIYDIFERLSDGTQNLANLLENVSIKNS